MKLRCPTCAAPIKGLEDLGTWGLPTDEREAGGTPGRRDTAGCASQEDTGGIRCTNGHRFALEDDVLVVLDAGFAARLRPFIVRLEAAREADGRRLHNPALYPQLPHAPALQGEAAWRIRQHDLALISRLLRGRAGLRVLEVGAWNGWLSHRLCAAGHHVVALDVFTDPYDGLRAMRFYPLRWCCIQFDLRNLDGIDEEFDLVVLNRCIQFFGDPPAYITMAQRRVAPGGLLVVTGADVFADPRARIAHVAALEQRHRERFDAELFLWPTRGYLDLADQAAIERSGLRMRLYPQQLRASLTAWLRRARPRFYYGVWKREAQE